MSHFLTFVIIPHRLGVLGSESQINSHIEPMLAPFSEQLEVPEYQKKCYCIGAVARREVEADLKSHEAVDAIRKTFHETHVPYFDVKTRAEREKWDADWEAAVAPIEKRQEKALLVHPLIEKPDPECDSCSGVGTYASTYNPKSKWDWYVIGGRWQGHIVGSDPEKNPKNFEACWVCGSTGKRTDAIGIAARAENPDYTCNGCQGKGTMLKAPSNWVKERNAVSVRDFLALPDEMFADRAPYAILTPDGYWRERGKMGWFGIGTDEKSHGDWRSQLRKLLLQWEHDALVAIDCHI